MYKQEIQYILFELRSEIRIEIPIIFSKMQFDACFLLQIVALDQHRLPTKFTLIFCTEFYYHANMSTNGNTRSRWCYYCCLVEKNKLTLFYSFKTVQMTRHKNMRILGTKYAQSARQSDITIQSRCFNWAKTLKTILNIFVINTNHI